MKKTVLIYVMSMAVFVLGVTGILHFGQTVPASGSESVVLQTEMQGPSSAPHVGPLWEPFEQNFQDPLAPLLLQFIVIILATRALGSLVSRFGHPAVIGEIAAGILLGPSLFGWIWPQAFALVFPTSSLGILYLFSQIGVCLFMFVVGIELDIGHLRQKARTAVAVSQSSIIVPYLLGVASAILLYPSYATAGTSFVSFALLMGIAMAITAFPVLARILTDRGMSKTELGVTAITCAAVGDATAWAMLAFVVALARATGMVSTFVSFALVMLFVATMLLGVRPLLARSLATREAKAAPSPSIFALVLVLLTASALTTHLIGIHALFGAFLAGTIVPRKQELLNSITMRLEQFSSVFLLPLFFAFSGLRTQVGLLDNAKSWLICLGIIAVATLGKVVGSMVPARLTGMTWNDAFSLGALMNTRGLVELIALNIGYDLGILPPEIFAMMVLMALTTTFMTGPLLNLAERVKLRGDVVVGTR
jgi:Kef-type K+ transport system membrane component KefB